MEISCDPFFFFWVGVTRLIGCKDVELELELDLFFFLEHEHVVWQQGHRVSSIYSSTYDKASCLSDLMLPVFLSKIGSLDPR